MHTFVGVILAAGVGSRMQSNLPKVLHKIFGKTMLNLSATALANAGAKKIIIVTGYKKEVVEKEITTWELNCPIHTVYQSSQLGTGHAVKMAKDYFGSGNVIVTCGDAPLITSETLSFLINNHTQNARHCTAVSTVVTNPLGYGRILRKHQYNINSPLKKIIEEKDASVNEKEIKEVNTGLYCFSASELNFSLQKLTNDNASGEYYLTDTIEILQTLGYSVDALLSQNTNEFFGVNTRIQLSQATKILQSRVNDFHMLNGITMVDPNTTYISNGVIIGKDTIIYPNCIIEGNTTIGENCTIGPHTTIKETTIGSFSLIQSSTVLNSTIGNNTFVGPYAHIRPNTSIGNNARIGNFTEIKNTTIGNNSKASHLSYIGDSAIGNNVNIGCGVITVNYDGKNKNTTTIEDDVFVGCNTNLIAPVTLHKNSYVAAGTTVTETVAPNSLAIGRVRQQNKLNWNIKTSEEA